MNERPQIYACPPTQLKDQQEFGLEIIPVEGAIIGICASCGIDVWVGPRQRASMKIRPGPVHCFKCVALASQKFGQINITALGGKGSIYIRKEQ